MWPPNNIQIVLLPPLRKKNPERNPVYYTYVIIVSMLVMLLVNLVVGWRGWHCQPSDGESQVWNAITFPPDDWNHSKVPSCEWQMHLCVCVWGGGGGVIPDLW